MALLVLVPSTYVLMRTVGAWSGAELTGMAREVDSERAGSLSLPAGGRGSAAFEGRGEAVSSAGAAGAELVRRSTDPQRADTVITDSLWILVFGKYGPWASSNT